MSCCGTKKKVPSQPPKAPQSPQMQNNPNYIRQSGKDEAPYPPKSRIAFLANEYEPRALASPETYVSTKKAKHFVQDRPQRLQNYAQQSRTALQSKLLTSKQILNYDLDDLDGVSKNYNVDTFHYQSALSHYFIHTNKDKIFDKNSQNYAIYEQAVDVSPGEIKSTKYF